MKYFGEAYLPKSAKEYKTKSKNAQEAHEAIRPSDVMNTPKKMEAKLDTDGYKLYELIWKRTVACQMNPAVLDKVVIDAVSADTKIMLRANGQVIEFDGFLKLYQESKDDSDDDDENRILPNVTVGEAVDKGEITPEQHFTTPPPRFTEASLVKNWKNWESDVRPLMLPLLRYCRNENTFGLKNCVLFRKTAAAL